jgi:DNA-binding response OmpR family regulator
VNILIVVDPLRCGLVVERSLAEQNYRPTLVGSCASAREAVARTSYGAIVLDVALPDGDGFELLEAWRQAGVECPILLLSEADTVSDRIHGLNLGADDCLSKPFNVDELVARVRTLLRRRAGAEPALLRRGPLVVDLVGHSATFNGERVNLTGRELALLQFFLQRPGQVLPRALIAEEVWGSDCDLETNLIDVYVQRLRQKLKGSSDQPLIRTVRGIGYELV